jgi:uncharacterized membrane protein
MTAAPSETFRTSALPKRTVASTTVHHPTVVAEARARFSSVQLRIADAITAFAGSLNFVYIHVVIFAVWMLFFEKSPWPTLTLVVSLEAIFLSTFVMIGQNRQAAFQQAKADHDYVHTERELAENTEITRTIAALTAQIKELTEEIHGTMLPATSHEVNEGDNT